MNWAQGSDTALRPRSQTCRPLSPSWDPGQACLQAWRQTAPAPVRVEGPWLRRGWGRDLLWARADLLKVKSLGLRLSGELGTPLCFKRLLSPRKGEHPQHPDLGF